MGVSFRARLWVGETLIDLNPFVEQILAGTAAGAVSSLKGTEDMKRVELEVERGEVAVRVDGKEIPLTPFPNEIIGHTLTGFVSALKGVSTVESFRIVMEPTQSG